MTELRGSGKMGRRLWIRTVDDRWAPVPYGAGQDDSIKSVNFWNAALGKWMTPTWGQAERNRTGIELNTEIPSLEMRAPGRTWTGLPITGGIFAPDNPNWVSKSGAATWTPMHKDWIRLFHLRPKTDPNWRIVPIGLALPDRVPNVAVNYINTYVNQEYRYFWPGVGYHQIQEETRHGTVGVYDQFTAVDNPLIGSSSLATENGVANGVQQDSDVYTGFHNRVAGTIDLQAIRDRLTQSFPEQGVDYIGQYAHIDTMKVRRVIIKGEFSCNDELYGTAPSQADINAVTFTVYARTDVPVIKKPYEDQTANVTFQIAAPIDITPGGQVIITKSAADLAQDYYPDPRPQNDRPPTYWRSAPYTTYDFLHTFESPGENNISFYARIENYPQTSATVDYAGAYISLNYHRIAIHYAIDGEDTPESTQVWNAIG